MANKKVENTLSGLNAVSGAAGTAISGGLSHAAGNTLQGASSIASVIPGPFGSIAGTGLNLIGGVINRLWGSQRNEEAIAAAEQANEKQANMNFNASTFDDLNNQKFSMLGTIGKNELGKDGVFSHDIRDLTSKMNDERNIANMHMLNSYNIAAENISNNQYRQALKNLGAFGGYFAGNGGDWSNGLIHINEGGTHEENPNEGVQVGIDPEGVPNLVEEGEVIHNNYVFSNRLSPNKALLSDVKLPAKYAKKSYSNIVSKISKKYEEMPNDPIAKRTLEDSVNKLKMAQEYTRQMKQKKENNIMDFGGNLMKYQRHIMNRPIERYWSDPEIRSKYSSPWTLSLLQPKKRVPVKDNSTTPTTATSESPKSKNKNKSENITSFTIEPKTPTYEFTGKGMKEVSNTDNFWNNVAKNAKKEHEINIQGLLDESTIHSKKAIEKLISEQKKSDTLTLPTESVNEDIFPKLSSTWSRYAPLGAQLGALIGTVAQKPDYSGADRIEKEAASASQVPQISTPFNARYRSDNPIDTNYMAARMGNQASATRRALIDNANGNIGAMNNSLLASNYNDQITLGDLYMKAHEANVADHDKTLAFNNAIDAQKAEIAQKNAMTNAANFLQAKQIGLQGITQGVQTRQNIDAARSATISSALSGITNTLSGIGRENFLRNGITSSPFYNYWIDSNGATQFKHTNG